MLLQVQAVVQAMFFIFPSDKIADNLALIPIEKSNECIDDRNAELP